MHTQPNIISPSAAPGLKTSTTSPQDIIETVCKHYKCTAEDIMRADRRADIVTARHVAMYITCQLMQVGPRAAGKLFKRNHSTITHAMDSVADRKVTSPAFAEEIKLLLNSIKVINVGSNKRSVKGKICRKQSMQRIQAEQKELELRAVGPKTFQQVLAEMEEQGRVPVRVDENTIKFVKA